MAQNPLYPARFSASRPLKEANFGKVTAPAQLQQGLQQLIANGGTPPKKKKSKTSQAVMQYLQKGSV